VPPFLGVTLPAGGWAVVAGGCPGAGGCAPGAGGCPGAGGWPGAGGCAPGAGGCPGAGGFDVGAAGCDVLAAGADDVGAADEVVAGGLEQAVSITINPTASSSIITLRPTLAFPRAFFSRRFVLITEKPSSLIFCFKKQYEK
jgi:hypothetical protein